MSDVRRREPCPRLGRMAKSAPPPRSSAGDRAVRVSSPDRVIYPATDRTPEVTKLMVAEYFAAVGDGPDAGAARPADRAGALARGRPARDQARHRPAGREGRRVLPEAGAQGRARLPGVRARSRSPPAARPRRSARPRSRCRSGARRWARSPSTRGRYAAPTSTTPTSCGSTSTRSPARLRRRGPGRRGGPRAARGARAGRLPEDLGQPWRAHLRADRAALGLRRRPARRDRVRPRAGAAGRRA